MKFLDLHFLIDGKEKVHAQARGISLYYRLWKELRSRFGEHNDHEAFIAGYTLGNNVVLREKYIKEIRQRLKEERKNR